MARGTSVRTEVEDKGYLWLLESLDRVNRAIQGSSDLEEVVNDTLDVVLEIFGCDRAWLLYPLDPEAVSGTALMERTAQGYPGILELGIELPHDPQNVEVMRMVLASEAPLRFGVGEHAIPTAHAASFSIRSVLALALHPKIGKPWLFGVHQCSHDRIWLPEEERLFAETGRRLGDALTSLLAHRDLRQNERKLAEAQRIAHLGYWERDLTTGEIDYSEETYRIFGLPPELRVLDPGQLAEHLHPDDRHVMLDALERAIAGGPRYDVDYRVVGADGEVRHVHSEGDVLFDEAGRPRRMFGTVQDITERKRTEETLILFRSLFDQTNDLVEVVDLETGRYVDVNETACRVHGYTREEYLALGVPDVAPAANPWEESRERRRTGPAFFEDWHRRKDGSLFPVEISATRVDLGRSYLLVVARDITERKQAERALVESHSLLEAVVEGTPDAVYVKDLEGRYLLMNEAGAAFLGLKAADVVGKTDAELFDPEGARLIAGRDRAVVEAGEPRTFEETGTAAGVTRTYLSTKSVYRDADGNVIGLIGISRDMTDLKRLEEQLRQSQKMEAVGRLAGGVAHDFNNLLTVITGHAALVFADLEPAGQHGESLVEILRAAERAAGLTRQLLAFSRKQVLEPRVVSLNAVLQDLARMLERLIGEDIELELALDPALALTEVDPGQFEQAIVNLVVNARDAMPSGGQLRIETEEGDDGVLVRVSDTGHGMDESTAAIAFEPFFTTKEGVGTGLGLPMVYGFVSQSGGRVEIDTEPGHGTTFSIWLPRSEAEAPAPPPTAEPAESARGTETVLLTEDDDGVRALARIVLESRGYTVLEARDGENAIRIAREHEGTIDLLLSDVVMARMSGPQLADTLERERPGLRVLFVSGYTGAAMLPHGPDGSDAPLLQKPFDPGRLAERVREVLDAEH